MIEHRPEPPTPATLKGTLIHRVLEGLFWNYQNGARSPQAAFDELDREWALLVDNPDFIALGLGPDQIQAFFEQAKTLINNYFQLEDPNDVRPIGVELGLEIQLKDAKLRGILDRLDITDDQDLIVIDYKTGRAPHSSYENSRLSGVHIYALLCQEIFGKTPVEVRLLYLLDPVTISAVPTEQSVRGQRSRTKAIWSAIERACESDDFRPKLGPLCRYCNFQDLCPAFGAEPPTTA